MTITQLLDFFFLFLTAKPQICLMKTKQRHNRCPLSHFFHAFFDYQFLNVKMLLILASLQTGFAQWISVASIPIVHACMGYGLIVLDSCSAVLLSFTSQVILGDSFCVCVCSHSFCVIDLTAQRFICQCGCLDLITCGLFCTPIPVAELSKHIPPKQPSLCPETTKETATSAVGAGTLWPW